MREKFDLEKMLREIKEDEEAAEKPNRKVSQDEIAKMLKQRRKPKRGER